MRPLPLDVAGFLLPILIGLTLLLTGRSFRRWHWGLRTGVICLTVGVVLIAGISLLVPMPLELERTVSVLGGHTVVLAWVASLFIGIGWAVPDRSFSTGFLVSLAALASLLIAIESSGRLWWRWIDDDAWNRKPDSQGMLQQSSSLTCSPAAAAMLLNRHGITASEGELAYRSGTSLFGTDCHSMARALSQKVESSRLQVRTSRLHYDECVQLGVPILAHVRGRYLGHAVLVESADNEKVVVSDPATGRREFVSRGAFEEDWNGIATYLVKQ